MYFLILLNSLSAFYFFVRELRKRKSKIHFFSREMTKIGIVFFCLQFINFVFYIQFQYIFLFLFLLYTPTLTLIFFRRIKQKIDENSFSIEFHQFIKSVSLGMRVGNSFRSAMKESYYLLPTLHRQRVESVMEFVVFSQHKKLDPKLEIEQKIYKELLKIDRSAHQAQSRIDLWIEQMDKERQFRHKSGQILHQLYIQVGIMGFMYLALLIFVAKKYGLVNNIKLILLSATVFVIGCLLCLKIGKKIKWNF